MAGKASHRTAGGPQRTTIAQQILGLLGLFLSVGPRSHRHTSRRASRDAQRRGRTPMSREPSAQAPQHGSAVEVPSDRSPDSVRSVTADSLSPTTPAPTPDLPADLVKSAETTATKSGGKPKTKMSLKRRLLRLVTCGGGKPDNNDSDTDSPVEKTPVTAFIREDTPDVTPVTALVDEDAPDATPVTAFTDKDTPKETPVTAFIDEDTSKETPVTAFIGEDAPEETPVVSIRDEASSSTVSPDAKPTVMTAPAAKPKTTRVPLLVPLKSMVPTSAQISPPPLKPTRCIMENDMVVEDFDEADFLLPSTSVSVPVTSAESLPSTPVPPEKPVAEPLAPLAATPVPWKVGPSPSVDCAPVDTKIPETPSRTRPRAATVRPTEARLLPSIAAAPLPAWKQWQVKHLYQMSLVNIEPRQQRRRGRTVSWDLGGVGTYQKVGRRGRKLNKKPKVTPPTMDAQHNLAAMLEARDTEASKRRQELLNERKFAMEQRRKQFEKNERRRQTEHAERVAKIHDRQERAESRRQELQDGVVQRCQSRIERVKSRCASRAATQSTLKSTDTACTTTSPDACSPAPALASSITAATPFDAAALSHDERPISSFINYNDDDDDDDDVSLPPTPVSSPRNQPEVCMKSASTEQNNDPNQRTKSKSEGCFPSTQRSPNTVKNKSDGCVLQQDTGISLGAVGGIPPEDGNNNKNFIKVYDVEDDFDFEFDMPARPKTYTLVRDDAEPMKTDGGRPKVQQAW